MPGALWRDVHDPSLPAKAFVVTTAPEQIKEILFDRERFAGGSTNSLIAPLVGERSVILAAGEEHMRKRKLLLPPFHGQQVARWSQQIADIATRELQALPVDRPIPLRPVMQRITFNVICRLVFGMENPARIDEFNTSIRRLYDHRLAPQCSVSPNAEQTSGNDRWSSTRSGSWKAILRPTRSPPSAGAYDAALALPWRRCPPWDWWLRHQPASREARMNNLLRFYN